MATQMTTNNKKALEGAPPLVLFDCLLLFRVYRRENGDGYGGAVALPGYPTFTPLFTPLFPRFSLDREGTYRTAAGVAYAKNIGDTDTKTNTDGTDKTPADATKKKEIITHGHRFGKRNGAYGMGKPFVHRKPTYKPCPQSPFPSSPFMV